MEGKVLLGQYLIWVMLLLGHIHGSRSCLEKEKNALLELKKYLYPTIEEGQPEDGLPTWTIDTESNCCLWEGVECDHTSGRIIQLNFSKSYREPTHLNLSLLHPFEEVRLLDIGGYFYGFFDDVEDYRSLRKLRKLETLDLSINSFNDSIFPFLNAATSLTTLILNDNDIDSTLHVKELKDLKNLEVLDLRRNKFNGSLQVRDLKDLKNLKVLDLSENSFNGSIQLRELPSALRKLKALSLRHNEFSGSIELQGVCKLKNIEELDLSRNKLVGRFPLCITSFTRLRVLDLSSNNMTGKLPYALGNLESLEYLSLFDNNFEGVFSLGSLTNLSKLKVLKFGSTSNSLYLESEKSWKPKFQLTAISLGSCNLEKVPHFLLYQKDLRYVDLSDNYIFGKFPYWLVKNITKLKVLLLQNNSFSIFQLPESYHNLICLDVSVNDFDQLFPKNIGWILPGLQYMNLAQNRFQGNLPSSLGNMQKLRFLDISYNHFHGKLPRSFLEGCYSLGLLKMSHNNLSGEIFLESANFTNIRGLSMDNNQFTGKIGQPLRSFRYLGMLDISNNNLTGVIPSWIGESFYIYALLLSNNSLEGEIPVSLFNFNFSNLNFLDLSANRLSGGIPPQHNSAVGVVLLLQDNNLSGAIPETLANVKVLDLRNNRLSGNIPKFINTQNIISMILLRGNNLTGRIPQQLCGLKSIQLLDLSKNRLNGSIPSCLGNTSFGFGKDGTLDDYYDAGYALETEFDIDFKSLIVEDQFTEKYLALTQTQIEFATKHRYDAYKGGNLKLLYGMDLSENELGGEIPVELGNLLELHALNLSHNKLIGVIPESFAGLKNVESFDLSFNRLQGRIPPQLTNLINLAVFNLSYNNLSGVIPQERQLGTFDERSYLGNHLLCGKPTNKSCNNDSFQEPDHEVEADESTIDMESLYWSFAAAYVTILLGIFASLCFDSPWSRFWFYTVDVFIHKVRNLLW